jgi:hypothetical protein
VRWAIQEPRTENIVAARSSKSLVNLNDIDYTTLHGVTTICEITSKPPATKTCFGFVIDPERKLRGSYNTQEWHSDLSPEILTLDRLLQNAAQVPRPTDPIDSGTLFKLERITLAVNLASSLLQLHGTPWVQERWNKQDILFFARHPNIDTKLRRRPVDIEKPLLNQCFLSNGNSTPNTDSTLPRPIHPNLSVLSLGIMLLELWFATPIESRRLNSDLVEGRVNSSTDLAVAERWVKENANLEDMPWGYWQAVKSCIYCFFEPMPRNKSLEDPDFRDAVWHNVVIPLERELQAWRGR